MEATAGESIQVKRKLIVAQVENGFIVRDESTGLTWVAQNDIMLPTLIGMIMGVKQG